MRYENVSSSERTQLVGTIGEAQRGLTNRRIYSIEKRELTEHLLRCRRLRLQHLFRKIIEDVEFRLLEGRGKPITPASSVVNSGIALRRMIQR